jgi:hypothetical protein
MPLFQGTNQLENSGIYVTDLNPFLYQQIKKECLNGISEIEKNLKSRTGDLLETFHLDPPKDFYFQEILESKESLSTEVINACKVLMTSYPEYMDSLGMYSEDAGNEPEFYIERFWINYQLPGEFVPLHKHSGIFSFAVWISLPEIINKVNDYNLMKGYQGDFEFTYPSITGSLKSTRLAIDKTWEGKMCVFPAQLHHQVYPHYENEIRISVAGNVRVKL